MLVIPSVLLKQYFLDGSRFQHRQCHIASRIAVRSTDTPMPRIGHRGRGSLVAELSVVRAGVALKLAAMLPLLKVKNHYHFVQLVEFQSQHLMVEGVVLGQKPQIPLLSQLLQQKTRYL